MTCQNKLSPKAPNDRVVVTFDFTNGLAVGETITAIVSITVSTIAGVDPTPETMLYGTAAITVDGLMAQQPVQGGLDGCFYQFQCLCDSSLGERYSICAVLPISSC